MEIEHLLPSIAEDTSALHCTPASPYAFLSWSLMKQNKNIALFFLKLTVVESHRIHLNVIIVVPSSRALPECSDATFKRSVTLAEIILGFMT